MSPKAWVRRFFIAFSCLAVLVTALNFLVDPYDAFGAISLEGLNKNKYYDSDRIGKSIRLSRDQFEVAIVGTSRVQIAIDPRADELSGLSAFNAAMVETNLQELAKVWSFILQHQTRLKLLIFGVDFLTFSDKRGLARQFSESLYAENSSQIAAYLRVLYSPQSVMRSLSTIVKNVRSEPPIVWAGHRSKRLVEVNHRRLFEEILSSNFFVNRETYACFGLDRARIKLFEQMLRDAAERQVKVYAFVPPLHAWQHVAMKMLGLDSVYREWVRELLAVSEKVRTETGGDIELWDFGGFNEITTEPIPEDTTGEMQHYWESSHYKARTGSLILERMLRRQERAAGFGVLLSSSTIGGQLAQMELDLQRYYDGFPEEIDRVRAIFDATATFRSTICPEGRQ
jgi:hypothetical protein